MLGYEMINHRPCHKSKNFPKDQHFQTIIGKLIKKLSFCLRTIESLSLEAIIHCRETTNAKLATVSQYSSREV